MPTDSSSQYSSQPSGEPIGIDGPLPLPEESPFLSDHGLGTPAHPPTTRIPATTPSDLSQFPPANTSHPAGGSSSPPKPSSHEPPSPSPAATAGPIQDALSSFAIFGGTEDPYAAARGSQSLPRSATGSHGGAELVDRLKGIDITTTDSLQGRLVELYLGVVTAEALVPTDFLLEGAERTGRFSRYKTSQQKLKSLEQLVLAELKLEADKVGGNAVVGAEIRVSLDHGVVLIVATGTAARMV
jgi:uncharacterized protein YbjQ (UPF0145 family)